MCKVKDCTLPNEDDNYCILHCKKDSWNSLEKDELNKKIELFWKTVQEEIQIIDLEERQKKDDEYHTESYLNEQKQYKNVTFPSFQDTKIENSYNFTTYVEYSEMTEEDIITIFRLNVEFIDCHFLDIADFSQYNFFKSVKFEKCHFYKGILFSKTHENHLEFNNCDFCSNNIDLSNRIFKSSLYFKDCKSIGKLDLHNSTIQGSASFRGSNLNEVNFEKTEFNNVAVFNETIFQNNVDFKYTSFDDRVYFQDVTIQGELNLSSTIFKDEVNFLGIKNKDGKELETENITNRETARIIKHSFEKLNNIIEANKFYALEMKAMWKELKFIKQPLNWIIFFLHGLSSNHSQNYLLPVLWISIISFAFCGGCNLIQNSFIESIFSIYYSNITSCIAKSIFIIEKESFSIGTLIYKSIIAYLIYQFIISIRQNTRRK